MWTPDAVGTAAPPVPPFDVAAANEAARQLELTAQAIGEALAVMKLDLPKVREGWEGPHRHWFDGEAANVMVSGAVYVQLLSSLAVAVRAKAIEAEADFVAATRHAAEIWFGTHPPATWPPNSLLFDPQPLGTKNPRERGN